MASGWTYDERVKRYRSQATGRFLPKAQVVNLRDTVVANAEQTARSLAERAVNGEITPEAFRAGMREAIRDSHGANYVFGRGGLNAMTPADFARLGRQVQAQFAYLDRFVVDVASGKLSPKQAAARAQLYIGGSVRSFEVGQASAWSLAGKMPTFPTQDCLGGNRCRCSWSYDETETAIEATWRLGGADPCQPCQDNARSYAPLVLPKPPRRAMPEPVRLTMIRRVA